MTDGNGKPASEQPTAFNIVKFRGDPKIATTLSGHIVYKKDRVVVPNPLDPQQKPIFVKMADYHMEHFVYVDPLFEKKIHPDDPNRYWWLLCTCGAPGILIGPVEAAIHEGISTLDILEGRAFPENMIVCMYYLAKLLTEGHGYHQGQDPRPWS